MKRRMRNSSFATLFAGIGISFSLLVPRAAQACWACTTDSECPAGFSCDENVGCMPTVDCQSDDDCGSGMRCVSGSATECSGTASETCRSINACAPIWQAGCGKDSDCGDGFTCVENGSLCNSLGCSTLAQCQAKESDPVACTTDSDCPSCWSCLDASDTGETCINPGARPRSAERMRRRPDPADASPTSSNGDAGNPHAGRDPAKTFTGSSGSSSSDAKFVVLLIGDSPFRMKDRHRQLAERHRRILVRTSKRRAPVIRAIRNRAAPRAAAARLARPGARTMVHRFGAWA